MMLYISAGFCFELGCLVSLNGCCTFPTQPHAHSFTVSKEKPPHHLLPQLWAILNAFSQTHRQKHCSKKSFHEEAGLWSCSCIQALFLFLLMSKWHLGVCWLDPPCTLTSNQKAQVHEVKGVGPPPTAAVTTSASPKVDWTQLCMRFSDNTELLHNNKPHISKCPLRREGNEDTKLFKDISKFPGT